MDKFTLLLITLFCIACAFFFGYYFGKNLSVQEIEDMKHTLQVSIHVRKNTLEVQKSHSDIRVLINGSVLVGTGTVELPKE